MIEPLRLSFELACSVEHAFDLDGTDRRWWPADHTVTGDDELWVVLEPAWAGGSRADRTGAELDWGEITVWEPPSRLAYRWHLRRDRGDATEVEIRFVAQGPRATRVEIEHRGWERLGASGEDWRDATTAAGTRCCRTI